MDDALLVGPFQGEGDLPRDRQRLGERHRPPCDDVGKRVAGDQLEDKADFVAAIKERRPTLEPVEVGHRTVSISQIGLIAMELGRKLRWDPAAEAFVGDEAANARLARPHRDWRKAYGG